MNELSLYEKSDYSIIEYWRRKVIEAVFVGDGLGREINRKGAEGAEVNGDG